MSAPANHLVGPTESQPIPRTQETSGRALRGTAALHRRNQRRFKIIEKLADVLDKDGKSTCADAARYRNLAYPIAGTIGMDEVVKTYIKLEMLTTLKKGELLEEKVKEDKKKNKKKKHIFPTMKNDVVFSDEIEFTTRLEVGQKTTLVLDAVVGRLRVTNASVVSESSREDNHNVIVALTRSQISQGDERKPDKRKGSKAKTAAISEKEARAKSVRQDLLKYKVVRDPRSQAALLQIDEDGPTRVAIELDRRRSLNDDDNAAATALGQRLLDVLKLP